MYIIYHKITLISIFFEKSERKPNLWNVRIRKGSAASSDKTTSAADRSPYASTLTQNNEFVNKKVKLFVFV